MEGKRLRRLRPNGDTPWSPGVALGVFLGCALVAYFFAQVASQFSGHELRAVGAAYGRAGDAGTVEMTGTVYVGRDDQCVGTFRPEEGGPVRTGVHVHLSGACEEGRVERARLVPGEDTWLTTTDHDRAYVDAGPGSGVGTSILLLVFVNAFCLVLGLLFAAVSLVGGGTLLMHLRRRSADQS